MTYEGKDAMTGDKIFSAQHDDLETVIRMDEVISRNAREALVEAIADWKRHMQIREMSHSLYFTDPYGRDADMRHLQLLQQQLAVA